jgi:aspartate/methionine/tyrosine aminotransferase
VSLCRFSCATSETRLALYSKEEIMQLAALVKKHDLFLISDEVYREFTYDGDIHYSVMNVPGLEEHAIMIDSVSKDTACAVQELDVLSLKTK